MKTGVKFYDYLIEQINDTKLAVKFMFSDLEKEMRSEMTKELLEMIVENSNDFTKDIAQKGLTQKRELSEKQAWCLTYQILNNKHVYLNAIMERAAYTLKNNL